MVRVIGAAIVSRGSHNVVQGRRFLTEHRLLVTHTLKRSAGIGSGAEGDDTLGQRVDDLADALMVIIAATGFLEVSVSCPILKSYILTVTSLRTVSCRRQNRRTTSCSIRDSNLEIGEGVS